MHVDQPLRAGALVKVVDILGDQQEITWPFGLEPRKCLVRRVGTDARKFRSPSIVEAVNQCRIPAEGLGRSHVFNAVAFPQAVGAAKGCEAAFGRNAGARQDHDVAKPSR